VRDDAVTAAPAADDDVTAAHATDDDVTATHLTDDPGLTDDADPTQPAVECPPVRPAARGGATLIGRPSTFGTEGGGDALPEVGEVLAGKFRIERVIAKGGMAAVLLAEHLQLRVPVAIKFLLPEALAHEDAIARFLREARSAVRIRSEHVVRIMDVGALENQVPYMVMEYLEGTNLSDFVRRDGPLAAATAVTYLLQACDAIAEAHHLGIVHRDLKPGNLFLTNRVDGSPLIKVLDFGISKVARIDSEGDQSLTNANILMGSPLYMSPEQVQQTKTVDARADVWALGAILYYLLTGVPPFDTEMLLGLWRMILSDPAPRLRARRPDASPELEAIILKCLEKRPAERPQTVSSLARMLRPFAPKRSPTLLGRIVRVFDAFPTRPRLATVDEVVAATDGADRHARSGVLPLGSAGDAEVRPAAVRPRWMTLLAAFLGSLVVGMALAYGAWSLARGDRGGADAVDTRPPPGDPPGATGRAIPARTSVGAVAPDGPPSAMASDAGVAAGPSHAASAPASDIDESLLGETIELSDRAKDPGRVRPTYGRGAKAAKPKKGVKKPAGRRR
jgi:serine/threonine-protein kinase